MVSPWISRKSPWYRLTVIENREMIAFHMSLKSPPSSPHRLGVPTARGALCSYPCCDYSTANLAFVIAMPVVALGSPGPVDAFHTILSRLPITEDADATSEEKQQERQGDQEPRATKACNALPPFKARGSECMVSGLSGVLPNDHFGRLSGLGQSASSPLLPSHPSFLLGVLWY